MRKSFYMNDRTVIINFSAGYCESCEDILSSEGFGIFLGRYLKDLAVREINIYSWLTKGRDLDVIVSELTRLFKQLLVLKLDEMLDPMVDELNRLKLLFIVHPFLMPTLHHPRLKTSWMRITGSISLFLSFTEAVKVSCRTGKTGYIISLRPEQMPVP